MTFWDIFFISIFANFVFYITLGVTIVIMKVIVNKIKGKKKTA